MLTSASLLIASFILSRLSVSYAVSAEEWKPPMGNITAWREEMVPSWVSDPRTHGTFQILYSCTFTLALCVYTAIHLNVPPRHEGNLAYYGRKTKWVLIALITPEVVLYAAACQRHLSSTFCKTYNAIVRKYNARTPTSASDPTCCVGFVESESDS
jgi:hypothetical protein